MIQNEESEQKEPPSVEVNGQKKLSESDFISKSLKASFKQKSFLGEGDEGKNNTSQAAYTYKFWQMTLIKNQQLKRKRIWNSTTSR